MESMTRLRVMRLLTEAEDRVTNVTYEDIPARLKNRAETIRNKMVDLLEEIRDIAITF